MMNTARNLGLALATIALPASALAADPAPRLEITPDDVSFAEAGASETLTLKNTGDAPLVIYGFDVIEEGFDKKRAEVKARGKVFTHDGPQAVQTLAPGQAIQVNVVYEPTHDKQKQAFGSLVVYTNDSHYRAAGGGEGESRYAAGVALRATGGPLMGNLLTIMVFFPLLAVIGLLLIPRGNHKAMRYVALVGTIGPLLCAIYLYFQFDRSFGVGDGNYGLQFVTHATWIKAFNIEYFMGTDGISVLMLLLTALVSTIACVSSFSIEKHVRGYLVLFLFLEIGMMGTFAALDFFLFYVFWEVMLLPMYFLIGIWGGPRKEYAAIKFFLYTLAGSVLMLLAIIALYYMSGADGAMLSGMQPLALVDGTPAPHTFNIMKMTYMHDYALAAPLLGMKFTYIIWIGLFIGFAIKVPMFPFHTWLPDAHVEAPTAISVILAGVLLKMGTYGMFRMNFAILPDATDWARTALAVFGVINILYGAFCAFAQSDLKKLVAYSSVSHMGYCLLGMAALTEQGMFGAMMQMFNHGTITAMLFLLVGVIYDRAHTREINAFGGVASVMPKYAAFFGFAFMASLGLPGLSGFIGEALVFLGAFNVYRVMTILAITGVIVTAAYHLWAMQRVHLGPFNEKWREALKLDMTPREIGMLLPLAIIVLFLGFYPMPALDLMRPGLEDLHQHMANVQTAVQQMALYP